MLISCYLITAGMTGSFFALQSYNNMFKNIYIFSIFQRKFVTLQYSLQPIPFLPALFFYLPFQSLTAYYNKQILFDPNRL